MESFKIFEEPAEMRTDVVNLKKFEEEEKQNEQLHLETEDDAESKTECLISYIPRALHEYIL